MAISPRSLGQDSSFASQIDVLSSVLEDILASHIAMMPRNLSAIFFLCVLPLFASASVQADNATSQAQGINDVLVHLHEVDQCPAAPKPVCSGPHCQGPLYICPAQFRCEVTTAFLFEGRQVTLTGCRCCPLSINVRCQNYDCLAPAGTRRCASQELERCSSEMYEDRAAQFHREFRVEDMPVLAEREVEENLIEVNDDGLLPKLSMSPARLDTTRTAASSDRYPTTQDHETYATATMAWPTMSFGHWQL